MPRVQLYQGGQVSPQGTTDARVRPADFGPGIGGGVSDLGQGVGRLAQSMDEIEDVNARVEANRLAVDFAERAREIGRGVKETLGEGASAAADQGGADLDKATKEILGQATPRARLILENELRARGLAHKDSWLDHGYEQKVHAFEDTSKAKIESIAEEASDEDDEDRAVELLRPAGKVIEEQARFFGKSPEWAREESRKLSSGFYKSRALKLAVGPNGSSLSAIEYATVHRTAMTDDDYNAVVSAYNDNALDEVATSEIYGQQQHSATTSTGVIETDAGPVPARRLDPVAFFNAFTVPHEGSEYVVDSNGAGVKYGINEAHNPGVNVKGLTQAKAAAIFTKEYFVKSGADKLPPALAAVHADTFFLNEKQAGKILKASGGDVDRYIELRGEFLNGLVASNPSKYGKYQRGWQARTAALAQFAARQGGDGSDPGITIEADTSLTDYKSRTMARTDIGMALKTKIIAAAERQRGDLRQERSIVEGEAADSLTSAAVSLGDKFTDVSQLPQDAWLNASPQARAQFTNMAKSNLENKPLSPEDASYIRFTEMADPKKFASKAFIDDLRKRGVPLETIRSVSARQGEIAGQLVSSKPDVVADGALWTIAKPAFEASGLLFDTVEETKSKPAKRAENIADAQKKNQALSFLRDMAMRWAQANPGKKADDATIRGWVGYALRNTRHGRGFELGTTQFFDRIDTGQKARVIREFMRLDPSWIRKPEIEKQRDVVDAVRDQAARGGF